MLRQCVWWFVALVACGASDGEEAIAVPKEMLEVSPAASGCLAIAIPVPEKMSPEVKIAWARGYCHPEALGLCAELCNEGGATPCFMVATALVNKDKRDKCVAEVARLGCELQHPGSCALLGTAYVEGWGTPKDPQRAAVLFHAACTHAVAAGCVGLANLWIARGEQTDNAVALLEGACGWSRGYGAACHELATMYLEGRGVPSDLEKARELYARGCEDHPPSCKALAAVAP